MRSLNLSSIAIAAITYYPKWYPGKLRSIRHTDKVRGDLAVEFLTKTLRLGYQVVVADGKSSRAFRKTLSSIPNLIVIKRRSLNRSLAKRQAIKKASKLPGIKVIVTSEPEKISLLDSFDLILKPIFSGKAQIVMPRRNDELFKKTHPSYMYESENKANKEYNQMLKKAGILKKNDYYDMFFGPRAISNEPKILRLFTNNYQIKASDYSPIQFFPIILALKKNFKIASVEIPFVYPKLQKENESRGEREFFEEKRKFQRTLILADLRLFLSTLR